MKFRKILSMALALGLVAGFVPANVWAQASEAADSEPIDFAALSPGELFALYRADNDRWIDEPCDFGVPILTQMMKHAADPSAVERGRFLAEALCADEQSDYRRGATVMSAFAAKYPDADTTSLTLYFARRNEDADTALSHLSALKPDQMERLQPRSFWPVVQMIRRAGQEDAFEDLALGWFKGLWASELTVELQAGLARYALSAAARSDNREIVGDLLSYITSPRTYVDLLTERKYEPLWPLIEKRAGPNLKNVGREDVDLKLARLENEEADRDRFSDAAHALHFNGQYSEVVKLAGQWRSRDNRGKEIEEGDGWALNLQAYAYDSLGEPEKADAVFDELAVLDPEEHGWVVNFVINRASRLVGQGRWEAGLAATDLARTVAENFGSTYAKMIIARDRACAFKKLGRDDAIEAELTFLRENSEDAIHLAAQGMMCLDQNDEAAKLLLDGLRSEATRGSALLAFQDPDLDLFYTQSVLPTAIDLLADHPELAAELAKHVRPMPEAYRPIASIKRKKLDLPSWN